MFQYHMVHWLFFFYMYCFFGWCFESSYVSLRTKKFVNRGFMRGPFLPLYGCGAVMMLVVSMPFRDNVVLTYLAGCVGATTLEYVTAVAMETLFNIRYWDYSNQKFNFQGRICLSSTIVWGFFTVMMTRFVHQPIERFVMTIPPDTLGHVTFVLTIYIVADFALSFKAALDLRDLLVKMQRVKEELIRVQKRLDVIIAFNNQEKEQKKQERELLTDELVENIGQRLANLKETVQSVPGAYVDNIRDEIAELRARYDMYNENRRYYKEMLDFYKRDMIRNNPRMTSSKFKDNFEELKRMVLERRGHE